MKKYCLVMFMMISWCVSSQDYNFQDLCVTCAEAQGFYCGDDPTNWTQYSPDGCVQTAWLNDGWVDCVDAGDETGEDGIVAEPTPVEECTPPVEVCDTVYVDIPVIEYVDVIEYIYEIDTLEVEVPFYIYETIIDIDTLYVTEYITQIVVDTIIEEIEVFVPEYIYVTDTVYAEVLDTMFIDIVEYIEVEVIVMDTIIETEYIEFFVTDTIIDYIEIIVTEYLDCETGMPCNSNIPEILEKSENTGLIYNILGQPIKQPESIYIEDGKVKYIMN